MDDAPLMRIGEIAAFYNVTVKAMRIYDRLGIIKPVKIDRFTGYRYYSPDQVRQLDALLEMKRFGFSLSEIKKMIDSGVTKEQYLARLKRKMELWRGRTEYAKSKIASIDEAIAKLSVSSPFTKMHELTEEESKHLLARIACLKDWDVPPALLEALNV